MGNLDIIDTREKLAIRSQAGLLSAESETAIPQPESLKKESNMLPAQ